MTKNILLVASLVVLILLLPASLAQDNISSSNHSIKMETKDQQINVKETVVMKIVNPDDFKSVEFWVQEGGKNVAINVNNTLLSSDYYEKQGNIYTCNLTSLGLKENTSFTTLLCYKLDKDATKFKKTLLRDTENIEVRFEEKEIYSASYLDKNTYFELQFYEPTETPLTWYIVAFIVLLIILLLVSTFYSYKKQKTTKKRSTITGSEELFKTKKALLMSLLKDLEKQYRAKKISDETYHKLKEQYKQDAVSAMKKLEDFQSEVK